MMPALQRISNEGYELSRKEKRNELEKETKQFVLAAEKKSKLEAIKAMQRQGIITKAQADKALAELQ